MHVHTHTHTHTHTQIQHTHAHVHVHVHVHVRAHAFAHARVYAYDLQTLALQHNRLTSLPPTVRGLTSLTDLSLTHNELVCADFVSYLPSLTQATLNPDPAP